jgi:hypothetical protein
MNVLDQLTDKQGGEAARLERKIQQERKDMLARHDNEAQKKGGYTPQLTKRFEQEFNKLDENHRQQRTELAKKHEIELAAYHKYHKPTIKAKIHLEEQVKAQETASRTRAERLNMAEAAREEAKDKETKFQEFMARIKGKSKDRDRDRE